LAGDPNSRSMSVSAVLPLLSIPTSYDALVFVGVVEPESGSVVIPEPSGSAGVGRSRFSVREAGQSYGVEVEALEGVQEGGPDVVASKEHGPLLRFPCN
jgi:hypothetical protein